MAYTTSGLVWREPHGFTENWAGLHLFWGDRFRKGYSINFSPHSQSPWAGNSDTGVPFPLGLVSRTWPDVAIAGAHRPGFTDKPRRPRQLASANTPTHPFIHRKGGRGHVWDGLAVRVHE